MANPRLTRRQLADTVRALRGTGGRRVMAAQNLGIPYPTFAARLQKARLAGMAIPPVPYAANPKPNNGMADELRAERAKAELLSRHLDEARRAGRKHIPDAPRPKIGKEDIVRVIRPDLHGSNQDYEATGAYLAAVKEIDPDELVGLGDLTDCGSFLAENHTLGYVAETTYSVADDVAAVNRFLDDEAIASPRARRYELEGNHDMRIERWCVTTAQRNATGSVQKMADWLLSKFGPEAVYEFKRRGIDYYKRGGNVAGDLPPGTLRLGRCLFTHGSFHGDNSCAAHLRAFGTNVVYGHSHRMASLTKHVVAHGTIGAWNVGFLAKRQPYWHHGKPSEWVHGFGVQVVSKQGHFQHSNVVIHKGKALLVAAVRSTATGKR